MPNSRETNDVFVVSQAALQGTCRPTHYVSVEDEVGMDLEAFQKLILQGCFNYQRATRSVSIHCAVYYADQACLRAKTHLVNHQGQLVMRDVKPELAMTMYWQ